MKNTADTQINQAFVEDVVERVIGAMEEKRGLMLPLFANKRQPPFAKARSKPSQMI